MNKKDLRYQKNETALVEAFLKLLATEKFSDIDVQKICRLAKINRSTFYLHYDSKNNLLEEIYTSVMENFSKTVTESLTVPPQEMTKHIALAFEYMAKYKNALTAFLNQDTYSENKNRRLPKFFAEQCRAALRKISVA